MSPTWKHRLKIIAWITGSAAVAIATVFVIASFYISRHARDWVSDSLTTAFKSEVDLASLRVGIALPFVQAEGDGLALHFEGTQGFASHDRGKAFYSEGRRSLELLRAPRHVQYTHLDGLQINIPPREDRKNDKTSGVGKTVKKFRSVFMDEIVSENATLKILTNKPGKNPLEFDIGKTDLAFHRTRISTWHFAQRSQIRRRRETIVSSGDIRSVECRRARA